MSRWSERKTLAAEGEVLPDEAELLDQNVEAENRSDSNEDADLSDEELLKNITYQIQKVSRMRVA